MLTLLRYVSGRPLGARRGRTALTLFGISLGVAMVMAVLTLNTTVSGAYNRLFSGLAGSADLEISALSSAGFSDSVLADAAAVPGVAAAVPDVRGNTTVAPRDAIAGTEPSEAMSAYVLGVVPGAEEEAMRTYVVDDGRLLQPDDEAALVITGALARQLEVRVGDTVEVLTVQGYKPFRVVGVIGPAGVGAVNASQLVAMPLSDAQQVLGKEGRLDHISVQRDAGADEAAVSEALEARAGDGVRVGPPIEGRAVDDVLGSVNLMLTFAGGLSLFSAFFLVYNNMAMAMNERRREYGILRAIGLSPRRLLGSIMMEAVALSIIGGALGLALGLGMSGTMLTALGNTLAGALRLGVGGAEFSPTAAATAVGVGLVAAFSAAIGPGLRAANLTPTDVLRPAPAAAGASYRRAVWLAPVFTVLGIGSGFALLVQASPQHQHLLWPMYVSLTLCFIGFVLATQAIVPRLPALLQRPLSWLFGTPGFLAARNLSRWPARTGTTAGAVLVALSMLVALTSLAASTRTYVHNWVRSEIGWDLLVSTSWRGIGAETPLLPGFRADLEAVSGVALASPERFVFIDDGTDRVMVAVFEMDEFGRFAQFNVADGPGSDEVIAALARHDGIAVSRPFAQRHGFDVGDIVELPAPAGTAALPIVAVVNDMSTAGGTLYIDRDLYIQNWHDDAVDAFAVKVDAGVDETALRERLLAEVGGTPLTIMTNAEFAASTDRMISESFQLIQAIVFVAVFVAGLGLMNTLILTVLERRQELAELRALGASQTDLRRMVAGEALGAGLVGTVLGSLAGAGVAAVMVEASRRFLGLAYPVIISPAFIGSAMLLGVVVAVLAGWGPARLAARLPIVSGLRME